MTIKKLSLPFFVLSSQIARSLIDNSNQTYGGQSIHKIHLRENDSATINRTWIKKKDSDLQVL